MIGYRLGKVWVFPRIKKIGNPCKSRVSVVRETGLEASENDKYETIEVGKALFFKGF